MEHRRLIQLQIEDCAKASNILSQDSRLVAVYCSISPATIHWWRQDLLYVTGWEIMVSNGVCRRLTAIIQHL